jgi:hypothetical protein
MLCQWFHYEAEKQLFRVSILRFHQGIGQRIVLQCRCDSSGVRCLVLERAD